MSLENPRSIDAIGTEIATGFVVLTIADSLDWSDEQAHLLALQNKLNAYLEFVESGQILETNPAAQNRQLVIDVVTKNTLPPAGVKLLEHAGTVASQINVVIRHKVVPNP